MTKTKSTVGLKGGRIDWTQRENQVCVHLANHGFSALCISDITDLTVGHA